MAQWPLVSVVIPAYNADRTIAETLNSVSLQTYRNIEIIVVDDGSTDQTCSIVKKFEPRFPLTLLTQNNMGVAAARNRGIYEAKGEFIAPVDADDLWHPTKICRQVDVMLRGGDKVGFVYCGRRIIDERSRVRGTRAIISCRGRVLCQHLYSNFVGNGSAPLFRRSAVLQVGGYSTKLREIGAEGCEDFLLQLEVARSWLVDLVPEYFVGYRKSAQQMSSDIERMHRSQMAVYEIMSERFEDIPSRVIRWSIAKCHIMAANKRKSQDRLPHIVSALLLDPVASVRWVKGSYLPTLNKSWKGDAARNGMTYTETRSCYAYFLECGTREGLRGLSDELQVKRLARLARYDEELPRVH